MEDTKVLDLKKAIFYYFMSWRVTILCIVLTVALLLGYTYLKPLPTSTPKDPEQSEAEMLEKRDKFIADNADAKDWNSQVLALEKEIESLEYQLTENLLLQIDPNKRINKSFILRFSYFMVDFKDEAEEIRTNQMLSLHYMKQLSGDRYLNYLASKGIIKYNPEAVGDLVDVRINEEGRIAFEVTGPEEIIIDQLIKTTKDYLERIIRPEIDLLAAHFLHFSDIKKEIIRDPSIILLRSKIENEISLKNEKIEELNKSIDEALKKEAEGNVKNSALTPRRSYKRNIILGLFLGFILSILVAMIRFRHKIVSIDVQQIAQENGIAYLGTLPYQEGDDSARKKRIGSSIDNLFIKMFGMGYDEEKATQSAEYLAQVLAGVADGLIVRDLQLDVEASDLNDMTNRHNTSNLFVPNADKSKVKKSAIGKLRGFLKQSANEMPCNIHLIAGGSLENDPIAVDLARGSNGILLIGNTSSKDDNLINNLDVSKNIHKDIIGIIVLKELM